MRATTLEAVDSNIGAMLVDGYAQREHFLGRQALADVKAECDSLKWWRRDQQNRGTGWHRAFVPEPRTIAEKLLYSPKPIPRILEIGLEVQEAVQAVGADRDIPILRDWDMNHIVVNKMSPRFGPRAVLLHRDPKYYSGLLAVASCAPAELKIGEEETTIPTQAGSLETFIGDDLTSGDQGPRQVLHAVEVGEDRYSVIFANDTREPQTFTQIIQTQLQNR